MFVLNHLRMNEDMPGIVSETYEADPKVLIAAQLVRFILYSNFRGVRNSHKVKQLYKSKILLTRLTTLAKVITY